MGDKYINRKPFLVFLILLFAFLLPMGCATSDESYRLGIQQASQQDWDNSVKSFQEALEANPNDPKIKLLLTRSRKEASMLHMTRGEMLLQNGRYSDAIKEFQLSAAFDPSNTKTGELIEKTKKSRDASHYRKQGDDLVKVQRYEQAREAYKKALELNPDNMKARDALAKYKKPVEKAAYFPVPDEMKKPISLRFKQTPIMNVFEVLTKITGINFMFDKDIKKSKVTLFVTDVSFDQFFDVLLKSNSLAAKLISEKTILIYPDTPAKVKEYQDLKIRTFYLSHLKSGDAVKLLSKILKSREIIENKKLNAVVVRGSGELIRLASNIIEANDGLQPEVILNIEILEVDQQKERQLGLDFSDSITMGIGETTSGISNDTNLATYGSIYDVQRISSKELILSLPTATLNLLKQDSDTQLLAKPQLRVKNGEKASIHIGERIPLRTNRRIESGTGAITYDYQYQEVGVRFAASPEINIHSEVTLQIDLEISSLGPNIGTSDDPQYSIKTRTAKSVLTLRDGEAVIIGGLITDEERGTVQELPGLGSVPVLGHLFSNHDIQKTKRDILMAVTPIVIRPQGVPSSEFIQFWSGQKDDFSLQVPYESIAVEKHGYLDRPAEIESEELDN